MSWVPSSIKKLIEELKKLPGIGERSAFRISYFLLKDRETLGNILNALTEVQDRIKLCNNCHGFTEDIEICPICSDERRRSGILCVVERPEDIYILESVQDAGWKYHVTGGVLSPVRGITADKLYLMDLRERIKNENFKELVIAFSPDVESDATISYIVNLLNDLDITISKIAIGLPRGIDITMLDPFTLKESLLGRRRLK